MPVDDTFRVEVAMPEGKKELTIILKSRGTLLTGAVEAPFGRYSFRSGNYSRNNFDWVINLKSGNEKPQNDSQPAGGGLFKNLGKFVGESLSGPPLGLPLWSRQAKPMKDMPVSFSGRINGDTIFGEMKFGDYATGKFRGTRVVPEQLGNDSGL
jgi:hypothetical protein